MGTHRNAAKALATAGWRRRGSNLRKLTHDSGACIRANTLGLWQAFDKDGNEVAGSPFVSSAKAREHALGQTGGAS